MDKTILTLVVIVAFVAGSITTGSIAFAHIDICSQKSVDSLNSVWHGLCDLQQQLNTIELTPGPQGATGPAGANGATGPPGANADPQDIIDLQNRVAFLESLHNFPPIVDLGPDQTHVGMPGGRGFICEGDDAFILGSGISDDGNIAPLVVTWTLNSASGFLWSVDGIALVPGSVVAPSSSAITFSGAQNAEGRQTSNWTVSAFDGEHTTEDTINLVCAIR